ncbi:hypothetical protein Q8A73_016790 [Channa argus]|nr:hypothetical protein Q8A73_016790 [Channa argus]
MAASEDTEKMEDILVRQLSDCVMASQTRSDTRKRLLQTAIENCQDEMVLQWLRENSESEIFSKLVDMFDFLKAKIDEEEKKNHSNNVDITFWAHGSIRLPMIPACCLLPLSSITDVVLYSPWNCVTVTDVTYGVATGKIKPQHRKFYCSEKDTCPIPDENHQPANLPDYWNSMNKSWRTEDPNHHPQSCESTRGRCLEKI